MVANAILLIRISIFAASVPLLSRLPIRQLEAFIEPAKAVTLGHERHAAKVEHIVRYTNVVCRLYRPFTRNRCMIRGLTLYYFLRCAGEDISLAFGVGKINDSFEGHCWLTQNGQPYLEATDPREAFTPVYVFNGSQIDTNPAELPLEIVG